MKFNEQLAATRANLDNLERLSTVHPALFDTATLISIEPEKAQVFLHASREPNRDWKTFVQQYPMAKWHRESGVLSETWDYRGVLEGVNICIIGAEKRPEAQPLFAEEGTVAA